MSYCVQCIIIYTHCRGLFFFFLMKENNFLNERKIATRCVPPCSASGLRTSQPVSMSQTVRPSSSFWHCRRKEEAVLSLLLLFQRSSGGRFKLVAVNYLSFHLPAAHFISFYLFTISSHSWYLLLRLDFWFFYVFFCFVDGFFLINS